MKRTQIQLPDRLYEQVKRLADAMEWSVSEVLRRGAEYIVSVYPAADAANETWSLPVLDEDVGPLIGTHEDWREMVVDDEARLDQYKR